MAKKFDSFYRPFLEKDEHKKSKEYKKLTPKMKGAVDEIFKIMDAKPSDFLNTFEKTIKTISKQKRVREKDLLAYFEKEVLSNTENFLNSISTKSFFENEKIIVIKNATDKLKEIINLYSNSSCPKRKSWIKFIF